MTEEEQQVLIWFLGRSGVLRVDIYDEAGFEEWYQEVRFGGRPWSWHEKVYAEREAGTADPREVQIQDMGERAYKQMLGVALLWARKFYYPGLASSGEHKPGPGQLDGGL